MIHDGHRERLRNRFLEAPESFEDHELLELLLFYSIPRANTNDIGHSLLDRFGSLSGILNADVSALTQVDKLGEKSAIFIRVISELLKRYSLEPFDTSSLLESPETLKSFLCALFVGTDNEKAYLLLFSNSRRLISCRCLSEGYCVANTLTMRDISHSSIGSNAAYAILVHNHPGGKPIPSGEDLATTNIVRSTLRTNGVTMLEHFIVAGNSCEPIMNTSPDMIYEPKRKK